MITYPPLDCFSWIEHLTADVNPWQLVEPLEVIDDIAIVLGPADFRDAEIVNELRLSHEIRRLSGPSMDTWQNCHQNVVSHLLITSIQEIEGE